MSTLISYQEIIDIVILSSTLILQLFLRCSSEKNYSDEIIILKIQLWITIAYKQTTKFCVMV